MERGGRRMALGIDGGGGSGSCALSRWPFLCSCCQAADYHGCLLTLFLLTSLKALFHFCESWAARNLAWRSSSCACAAPITLVSSVLLPFKKWHGNPPEHFSTCSNSKPMTTPRVHLYVLPWLVLQGWLIAQASPTPSPPPTSDPSFPSSCVQICNFKLKPSHSSVGWLAVQLRTPAPSAALIPSCRMSQFSWAAPAPEFKNRRVLHYFDASNAPSYLAY